MAQIEKRDITRVNMNLPTQMVNKVKEYAEELGNYRKRARNRGGKRQLPHFVQQRSRCRRKAQFRRYGALPPPQQLHRRAHRLWRHPCRLHRRHRIRRHKLYPAQRACGQRHTDRLRVFHARRHIYRAQLRDGYQSIGLRGRCGTVCRGVFN